MWDLKKKKKEWFCVFPVQIMSSFPKQSVHVENMWWNNCRPDFYKNIYLAPGQGERLKMEPKQRTQCPGSTRVLWLLSSHIFQTHTHTHSLPVFWWKLKTMSLCGTAIKPDSACWRLLSSSHLVNLCFLLAEKHFLVLSLLNNIVLLWISGHFGKRNSFRCSLF